MTVPFTSAAAMSAAIDAVCRVLIHDGTGVELVVALAAAVGVEATVVAVTVATGVTELTAERTLKGVGCGSGAGFGSVVTAEAAENVAAGLVEEYASYEKGLEPKSPPSPAEFKSALFFKTFD